MSKAHEVRHLNFTGYLSIGGYNSFVAGPSLKQLLTLMSVFASAVLVSMLAKRGVVTKTFEDFYFIGLWFAGMAFLMLESVKTYRREKKVYWVIIAMTAGSFVLGITSLLHMNGLITKAQDYSIGKFTVVSLVAINVLNFARRNKKRNAKASAVGY